MAEHHAASAATRARVDGLVALVSVGARRGSGIFGAYVPKAQM
jgi:hypothetical protein